MPPLITLFRPVNLILIVIIQVIIQYRVIIPLVESNGLFTHVQFALIVCITIIVGASGYVINDICDVAIDSRNKPGKNIVGTGISTKTARGIYISLVLSGLILTAALDTAYRLPGIAFYSFSTIALYFYSTRFKKSLLIGNLIVSAFAAMVVYVLWMGQNLVWQGTMNDSPAFDIVMMYSVFAFVSTLIREIVKDIEDLEGDQEQGARTLPVVLGIKGARTISAALGGFLSFGLVFWLWHIHESINSFAEIYFIIAVILPVTTMTMAVIIGRDKRDWHRLSQFIKVVILLGTLFLLLI